MKMSFIQRYFSIVFIVATILVSFHHHDDLRVHNDCQVCTISSSIIDADTPIKVSYLSKIEVLSESIVLRLSNLCSRLLQNHINSRAPPKILF
jgi:hypothetical protein